MQEQEDSEEGETPADPSAGEWLLGGLQLCLLDLSALRKPSGGVWRYTVDPGGLHQQAVCRKEARRSRVQEGACWGPPQSPGAPGGHQRKMPLGSLS